VVRRDQVPLVTACRASGFGVELSHGNQRAVVVEVGGGLREYTVGGEAVVDGYGPDEMCSGGRGQILAPWPNRIGGGTYEFGGSTHHLPLSEPDRHNAIHGLVRWANWIVAERAADRAVMTYRLHPQPGYPFLLRVNADYRLSDSGLAVTIEATNVGDLPAPFGAGFHPYLRLAAGNVDRLELCLPAERFYETDTHAIPTRALAVEGSTYDFRTRRAIGPTQLDTAFTALARRTDGLVVAELTDPEDGRQIRLWCDEGFGYLMVFSGDTLPAPQRRRALAIEPMTCAPDAFRSGDGLVVLQPEDTVAARWGITPPGLSLPSPGVAGR
jgi:aldose 1-epimerase